MEGVPMAAFHLHTMPRKATGGQGPTQKGGALFRAIKRPERDDEQFLSTTAASKLLVI